MLCKIILWFSTAHVALSPGADLRGARGDQALLPPQDTWIPPKASTIFGMKQWRKREEKEEEKGRKKKRVNMSPLYLFNLDSPLTLTPSIDEESNHRSSRPAIPMLPTIGSEGRGPREPPDTNTTHQLGRPVKNENTTAGLLKNT